MNAPRGVGLQVGEMGCSAPDETVDALFRHFDRNGNFTIDYEELHDLLS